MVSCIIYLHTRSCYKQKVYFRWQGQRLRRMIPSLDYYRETWYNYFNSVLRMQRFARRLFACGLCSILLWRQVNLFANEMFVNVYICWKDETQLWQKLKPPWNLVLAKNHLNISKLIQLNWYQFQQKAQMQSSYSELIKSNSSVFGFSWYAEVITKKEIPTINDLDALEYQGIRFYPEVIKVWCEQDVILTY